MKRAIPILLGVGILAAFVWTLVFLYKKSQARTVVYDTETAFQTDIVKKTVATGAIVPREEIEIKPRVSGVVAKLHVEPGAYVEKGDLLADIQIIPDSVTLNRAQSAVSQARISLDSARQELARNQGLYDKKVLSAAELDRYQTEFRLKQQEYQEAVSNLQLVKDGATRGKGQANTQVRSTVEGMVLLVPVKVGESVIESNTFNPGTTIAAIADMNDMIFQGKVDESEVGKVAEGMELSIKIGAIEDRRFKGKLEYIAPKGVLEEGAIQFEIKAAIELDKEVFIRAGYSANADIVLDRATGVLAINESVLQFDDGKPYVEVEVAPQRFERRDVEVGLSDGIKIEVKKGITTDDQLKKPNPQ